MKNSLNLSKRKVRAPAWTGEGNGARRTSIFRHARRHIEQCISSGYNCEAIALIESVISDRLESRLSYLTKTDVGFKTLGYLLNELRQHEADPKMLEIAGELDKWRIRRNEALHELVKVEANKPFLPWEGRMKEIAKSATDGYVLLLRLYHQVADLHTRHPDRIFPFPPDRK